MVLNKMKNITLILLNLFLLCKITAQNSDCLLLVDKGDSLIQNQKFDSGVNYYHLAKLCDPQLEPIINKKTKIVIALIKQGKTPEDIRYEAEQRIRYVSYEVEQRMSYEEEQRIRQAIKEAEQQQGVKKVPETKSEEIVDETLPTFTFNQCYATFDIPNYNFIRCQTLGNINEQLQLSLDKKGYTQRSYFSVKNGFAIVTQMEQYEQEDGTIRNDRTRWLEYPARDNFKGIIDYFTSVVMPNKGHFRIFVFVITDLPFKSNNERISKSEAAAWLNKGLNRLPQSIANIGFTERYVVSVLVYEFEVPESNRVAKQVCPTPRFDARTHLMRAGIGF